MQHAVVAYCRAGFEDEAASDLRRIAAQAGVSLAIPRVPDAAVVVAGAERLPLAAWDRACAAVAPIFARTVFAGHGPVALLDPQRSGVPDRVTPLLGAIDELADAGPWRSAWVEYPDTNDGKSLSPLSRALAVRLDGTLRERGRIADDARGRLHILLMDGATAFVGTRLAHDRDWPLGIPRLRMPPGAPSRSTLKLAEAFGVFLGESESRVLRPGLRAVDLGAAPGGWTWQLAQRGLKVIAVDNGPLKGAIAEDSRVTHLREDGLRWRPSRPVDWLVCDIVEQPIRIADLVAHWIADGAAHRAIFNLKLPMKKRYDEVRRCEERIAQVVEAAGLRYTLAVRQLYHDREEVTAYLARIA